MKKGLTAQKNESISVYPVAVSMIAAILSVLVAGVAVLCLRMNEWTCMPQCLAVGLAGFVACWATMAFAARLPRKALLAGGAAGMILCAAAGGWIYHSSNFQLTDNSFQTLDAAKVPADLIADLKSAEGAAAETEAQFVSDLAGRFGLDHIAPYREALVQSGWRIHRRAVLAAALGFCVCFSLTAGAALARPVYEQPRLSPQLRHL